MASARASRHGPPALAVLAVLSSIPWLLTPTGVTAQAPARATFEVRLTRTVSEGTGTYAGYHDSLVSSGRYRVEPGGGGLVIDARYSWRYQGETCEDGEEMREVRVSLPDRIYLGRTDLDDYDAMASTTRLGAWMWIAPTVRSGEVVRILEHDFTVERGAEVEIGGRSVPAILAQAHGASERHDAYGRFRVLYSDSYWFDEGTGWFLRTEHTEVDENDDASFEQHEVAEVTSASYLPVEISTPLHAVARCPRSSPSSSRGWSLRAIMLVGMVAGLLLFFARIRAGRTLRAPSGPLVETDRLSRPEEVPAECAVTAGPLGPFLPRLARAALRAGDRVSLARSGAAVTGLAITDEQAHVVAVFSADADTCEALRRDLGITELWSDTRHEVLPGVVTAARAAGKTERPLAYNLVETYEVLTRPAAAAPPWDARRVTSAEPTEAGAIGVLADAVTGLGRARWISACLANGDVALVARGESRVDGVVLLAVVDRAARLHGLAVHPDARGRGLGTELVRAAIAHAEGLGAHAIVCEVPSDGTGARTLLEREGFVVTGQLFLESASETRPTRRIPWR